MPSLIIILTSCADSLLDYAELISCDLPNCRIVQTKDVDDCRNILSNTHDFSSCIITTHLFVDSIQSVLCELISYIESIYVLADGRCERKLPENSKFRGPFNHIFGLIDTIQYEQSPHPLNPSDLYQTSTQNLTNDTPRTLWYHYFISLLVHMEPMKFSRREMIARVRHIYRDNPARSYDIYLFEQDHSSNQILRWFTKDSFVHQELNKVLRSEDMDMIFVFQNFIHDLDSQLRQKHSQQPVMNKKNVLLYRGQRADIDEIRVWQANIGNLFVINGFCSTSWQENVGNFFCSGSHPSCHPREKCVLFTLSLDEHINRQSVYVDLFADGYSDQEKEVLFTLRSLCRIDSVEYIDKLWHVKLTLVDEDNEQFRILTDPWKSLMDRRHHFVSPRQQQYLNRDFYLDNDSTLTFRILIDIVLRLQRTFFSRQEMIDFVSSTFRQNFYARKEITTFQQNYSPQNAVKWYTRDCFFFHVICKSLSERKVENIMKVRHCIRDVFEHLTKLYTDSIRHRGAKFVVYRGQMIHHYEVERLRDNMNKFTRTNNFLLASQKRTTALRLAREGRRESGYVSVLYSITIDTNIASSIPLFLVDDCSKSSKHDVILPLGSVFSIDSVEQTNSNLWEISLTLTNHEDEQWRMLTEHLNRPKNDVSVTE